MKIDFRLKKVLKDYGLRRHGVISRIADEAEISRHTVARPYLNEARSVSLQSLEKICDWLHKNGVPSDVLPGALFGLRPSELWRAIAALGRVQLYMGERYEPEPPAPWRWVSSRDNAVSNGIVGCLSRKSEVGGRAPQIEIEYVPFGFGYGKPEHEAPDRKNAREIFARMRADESCSKVLIGSQRVNLLVEYYIADLFGRKPFTASGKQSRCPFHTVYRESDAAQPSCFGGRTLPGQRKGKPPGIYYRDGRGKWLECPWVEDEQDAGVVIARRDPGTGVAELVIFGFSGRSTEATGQEVLNDPDAFWSPTALIKGTELAVHIIRYGLRKSKAGAHPRDFRVTEREIVKIDEGLLKEQP